jgi:hypothetical protein
MKEKDAYSAPHILEKHMDGHVTTGIDGEASVWLHVHGGPAGGRKEKDLSRVVRPFIARHLLDSPPQAAERLPSW